MKIAIVALIALISTNAINLDSLASNQIAVETLETIQDGPTNGEMSEDEKDTLIQVLCPGNVQTSFSQGSGKSSTCNGGVATAKKAKSKTLVQESEEVGDAEIA